MQLSRSSIINRKKPSSVSNPKRVKLKLRNKTSEIKINKQNSIKKKLWVNSKSLLEELQAKIQIYKNIFSGIEKLTDNEEEVSILINYLNSSFTNRIKKFFFEKDLNTNSEKLCEEITKSAQKIKERIQCLFPIILETFFLGFLQNVQTILKYEESSLKDDIRKKICKSSKIFKGRKQCNIFKESSLDLSQKLSLSNKIKSQSATSEKKNLQNKSGTINSLNLENQLSSHKSEIDDVNLSPIKKEKESEMLSNLNEFN